MARDYNWLRADKYAQKIRLGILNKILMWPPQKKADAMACRHTEKKAIDMPL